MSGGYLTYEEAAARLGLHKRSIQRMVAEGLPTVYPRPRSPRITIDALDKFLRGRTATVVEPAARTSAPKRSTQRFLDDLEAV